MGRSTPKLDAVTLPSLGSIFLMPLADGRYGACRVIRHGFIEPPRALVVVSRWIGAVAPAMDEPLLQEPLILNYHSWKDHVAAFYAFDDVPGDFRLLGVIAPRRRI